MATFGGYGAVIRASILQPEPKALEKIAALCLAYRPTRDGIPDERRTFRFAIG